MGLGAVLCHSALMLFAFVAAFAVSSMPASSAGTVLGDTTYPQLRRTSALGPAGIGINRMVVPVPLPDRRSAQSGRRDRGSYEREPEDSDDFRARLLQWLRNANRTYQGRIVPRLSLGGQAMSVGAQPRRRARVVKIADPNPADRRAVGWDIWLAYARDTYDGEIVPRLTGKRKPGGLSRPDTATDDDRAARLRREREQRERALRDAEAERLRAARERQAAEAARRRAEQERSRLEAERKAREDEKRRAEQLAAAARAAAATALAEAERRRQAEIDEQKRAAERRAREEREKARLEVAALEEAWRRQERERAERARAERERTEAAERRRLAAVAERLEKIAAARARRNRDAALRARRLARLERLRQRARRRRAERQPVLPERRPTTERTRTPDQRLAAAPPLPERALARRSRRPVRSGRRHRQRGRRVAVARPVTRPRARSRKVRRVRRRRGVCRRRAGRRIRPPGVYVVRPGDSLWRIARMHYARGRRYRRIWKANRRQIAIPRLIYPCQRLFIPRRRRS